MSIFDKFKKTAKPDEDKTEPETAVSKTETKPQEVKELKVAKVEKVKKVKAEKPEVKISKVEKDKITMKKDLHGVLIRPLITERATSLSQYNQYVFAVKTSANKIQVAQAILSRYGIKPIKVNMLNNSGKDVRYGRNLGRTKDWKKAIITLPAGQSIQVNEGV